MRWILDPAHTHIAFSVQHMGVTFVTGYFTRFSGEFSIDEDKPERSSFAVTIDVASVTSGNAERDAHLRAPEFFDAARWPAIAYHSDIIMPLGFDTFNVEGELTIRGTTHPARLSVKLGGVTLDPEGYRRAGFSARGHIDREDFGLIWNAALESGGVVLGSRVRLEIEAELVEYPNAVGDDVAQVIEVDERLTDL
jgi:polyisoprenoid-binding protein YceI